MKRLGTQGHKKLILHNLNGRMNVTELGKKCGYGLSTFSWALSERNRCSTGIKKALFDLRDEGKITITKNGAAWIIAPTDENSKDIQKSTNIEAALELFLEAVKDEAMQSVAAKLRETENQLLVAKTELEQLRQGKEDGMLKKFFNFSRS